MAFGILPQDLKLLLASATHTPGTGSSNWMVAGDTKEAIIFINVTAIVGTSVMTITVEQSYDEGTTVYPHSKFDQTIAVAGQYAFTVKSPYASYIRVSYTVANATSMTFYIYGVAKYI